MKRKILLFLISASVIMSCDEAKDSTLQIGNQMAKILTQDEAMANLYHFMNDVGYSCTRSDFEKSIQSIDTYPIITKSESSVEAYIVNFEDNSGYAVLGARTDMIPVIALTEEGNIDPITLSPYSVDLPVFGEDSSFFWPALPYEPDLGEEIVVDTVTYDNIYCTDDDDYYVGGEISDFISIVIDSGIKYRERNSMPSYDIYEPEYDPTEDPYASESTPIDTMLLTNWGQRTPYNNFCKIYNGTRRLAGCSSVAAAMIMAYNKFPTNLTINGVKINWDVVSTQELLTDSTPEPAIVHVPLLIGSLFWKCNRLACKSFTMITAAQIRNCFTDLGYTDVRMMKDSEFNDEMWSETLTMLRNGKPVYVSAIGRTLEPKKKPSGHSWVIEGAQADHSMLYCNWGWYGASNGYFSKDCFTVGVYDTVDSYSKHFRVITYNVPSTSVSRFLTF